MATLFRTFAINWLEKRLQNSVENGGEMNFPDLQKYECIPFKFYIVETDPDLTHWSKIAIDSLGLKVTISADFDSPTPLAQQTVWTKDTDDRSFYGELDLNTALMNAYMGTSEYREPYIQMQLTEGTANTVVWQKKIKIKFSLTTPTSVSPDPSKRYLDADEIDATYARYINAAGKTITFTSPGNVQQREIGVTDGAGAIDNFYPVI